MARRFGAAWALAFLLTPVVLVGCSAGDSKSTASTQPTPAAYQVETPFPLPVIEMAGTGEEMGTAHGRQLGGTIRDLHGRYLKAYFSSEGERFLAMTAAATFEKHVSPEHLEEIRALARASGVNERQMVLAH